MEFSWLLHRFPWRILEASIDILFVHEYFVDILDYSCIVKCTNIHIFSDYVFFIFELLTAVEEELISWAALIFRCVSCFLFMLVRYLSFVVQFFLGGKSRRMKLWKPDGGLFKCSWKNIVILVVDSCIIKRFLRITHGWCCIFLICCWHNVDIRLVHVFWWFWAICWRTLSNLWELWWHPFAIFFVDANRSRNTLKHIWITWI